MRLVRPAGSRWVAAGRSAAGPAAGIAALDHVDGCPPGPAEARWSSGCLWSALKISLLVSIVYACVSLMLIPIALLPLLLLAPLLLVFSFALLSPTSSHSLVIRKVSLISASLCGNLFLR